MDRNASPRAVVRGTVRDADGRALPKIIIRVYDQDLRRREQLGDERDTRNGDNGSYEIYNTPKA
jgi:hypothetical protein